MYYDVVLLDKDGNTLASCDLVRTLATAKKEGNAYLSDKEYANDAHKVEARNSDTQECVWDKFKN